MNPTQHHSPNKARTREAQDSLRKREIRAQSSPANGEVRTEPPGDVQTEAPTNVWGRLVPQPVEYDHRRGGYFKEPAK